MATNWADEYLTMVRDCQNRSSALTPWQNEFIESIGRQLAQGKTLSLKQTEQLDRAWEKATSRGGVKLK